MPLTESSRNATSPGVGSGTSGSGPSAGSSVSPAYTLGSPGTGSANTNLARSPGTGASTPARSPPNAASASTRCEPRLGRSGTPPVSWPAHTPAAFTTAPALSRNEFPVSVSVRTAPSPARPLASHRVRMTAPCAAAVRAIATTSRASSVSWPSQVTMPPVRSRRRHGTMVSASALVRCRGPGSVCRLVRAARRS